MQDSGANKKRQKKVMLMSLKFRSAEKADSAKIAELINIASDGVCENCRIDKHRIRRRR
jgi:hypothetical protein